MKRYLFIFLAFTYLEGTYITDKPLSEHPLRGKIYQTLMLLDEPRALFLPEPLSLEKTIKELDPSLELIWIPSLLWQCSALHAYAHSPPISLRINQLDLLNNFDEEIVHALKTSSFQNVLQIFDQFIKHDELEELFFALNDHTLHHYQSNYTNWLTHILVSLPKNLRVPYCKNNPHEMVCVNEALQSTTLMHTLLEIELQAAKQNKYVFYRGTSEPGMPNSIHFRSKNSHALSFGSTLLGGLFHCTDACALRYAFESPETPNHFIAVSLDKGEIHSFFRMGPLHPFLQLFADGEFFHAHTKMAESFTKRHGYFAKCNHEIEDSLGYVMTHQFSKEELAEHLTNLFNKSAVLFPKEALLKKYFLGNLEEKCSDLNGCHSQ